MKSGGKSGGQSELVLERFSSSSLHLSLLAACQAPGHAALEPADYRLNLLQTVRQNKLFSLNYGFQIFYSIKEKVNKTKSKLQDYPVILVQIQTYELNKIKDANLR